MAASDPADVLVPYAGRLALPAWLAGRQAVRNGAAARACECGARLFLERVREDSRRCLEAGGWAVTPAQSWHQRGGLRAWLYGYVVDGPCASIEADEGCTCIPF